MSTPPNNMTLDECLESLRLNMIRCHELKEEMAYNNSIRLGLFTRIYMYTRRWIRLDGYQRLKD
jgi:hypothetical protein